MTERCLKWNIMCPYAPKLHLDRENDIGCILDNTETCNRQVIEARKLKQRKFRVDKFDGKARN